MNAYSPSLRNLRTSKIDIAMSQLILTCQVDAQKIMNSFVFYFQRVTKKILCSTEQWQQIHLLY